MAKGRLFLVMACLVASFASCSRTSKSVSSWPPVGYASVKAYIYNLDGDDSAPLLSRDRLSESVLDAAGSVLSQNDAKRFIAAVSGSHPEHPVAGCYIPRHGLVFYEQSGEPVGWVEICFECLNYRASSEAAPKYFDIESLRQLFLELKIPVLKSDGEYQALKRRDG
jgi:hypothetical protein